MSSRGLYLALLALLTVLLGSAATVATATSTQYGGSVQAPSGVVLHSVCGDATRGLLFAVGTDGTNGVIYRVDNLTEGGFVGPTQYKPGWASYITFYACEVVDNYLFVVGEGQHKTQGVIQSVIVVYNITQQKTLSYVNGINTGVGLGTVKFRDVDVKKMDSKYYIYTLSIVDSKIGLYYTSFTKRALGRINSVSIGTGGDGYGVSIWGNYLGLLWKDAYGNLKLEVFDISSGAPTTSRQTVTVLESFAGIRASEAAYSEGFLVAVAGKLYRVYLSGGNWTAEEFVEFNDPNVAECNPYAMLVAEHSGAKAAYIFSQTLPPNIRMCFIAVDLVGKGVITDSLTILQLPMEGYGDAYIVWVDSETMNIVPSGNSHPYMVYTITDGVSTSYLIYYDLTRGGSLPYPVPEAPLLVAIGTIVAAGIAIAVLARREY